LDEQFRKSALTIGRRMAALSGAMVVLGAALFSGALWWKVTHGSDSRESTPHVTLSLDVVDLAVAFAAVGVVAVAVAGGAAFFFTRQATQPLELAMERQRNFIADASHELRTPLSTMHMRVQQLQALNSDDALSPVIAELRRDTSGMVDIVGDLLAVASGERGDGRASLVDATTDALRELQPQADALGVTLTAEPIEASVNLSGVALTRCLTALLTNAVSHTPPGGSVALTAVRGEGAIVVRVSDSGSGIKGIPPDRIFDRFAQGAPGSLPSHGIGLALVRDTVAGAGGSVGVESTGERGTVVKLVLHEAAPARG